ncbi:MAG: ChbG/HpnK family deacetylase [Planctomycetaceae bacterium]|nr:ChbG/HpnK family deacetylase [Planctomycetaceae bacterium]
MNLAVNQGILAGFLNGLLTSTSVLANAPALLSALDAWRDLSRLQQTGRLPSAANRNRLGECGQPFDLGVHLNLTQGRPVTGRRFPAGLLDANGRFLSVFSLLPRLIAVCARARLAIRDELAAQIERVLEHGAVPTHLNGHQYVEMLPVVAGLMPQLLEQYRIGTVRVAWERGLTRTTMRHRFQPADWCLAQVKRLFAFDFLMRMRRAAVGYPDAFFGTAHAGRIDLNVLRQFIDSTAGGLTEIGVHPGETTTGETRSNADGWDDPLAALRPQELQCLTSPELVDVLFNQQIDLGRLAELAPPGLRRAAA